MKLGWLWPLVFGVAVGCGTTKGSTGGSRTSFPAPGWYAKKPTGVSKLYFVGAANGASDESMARELAVQAALAELTVFCGATAKSEAVSEEVEKNGVLNQSYSLTVDVAGDEMTIKEAEVKDAAIGQGSDGSYDAYVLIEWPKARYAEVVKGQQDRAQRALDLYIAADTAATNKRWSEARTRCAEAKTTLGPMRSMVPVRHAKLTNTTLLYDAIADLSTRLESMAKERKGVMAVAVECDHDGKQASCQSHRVGAIKQQVATGGFKVATEAVDGGLARQILAQANPESTTSLRNAGYVLAVQYSANLTAKEDGFTFVHCGARGVVYDTDANRVISVKEVKPQKGGHVHFKGAMEKGCSKAEADMVSWLQTSLGALDK
ncbi:MAG: hypothetical protein RIT81_32180 [Deltaproteobacteria bacterium]